MCHQHRVVCQPEMLRLLQSQSRGGRCRLKTDGEKNNLPLRVLTGEDKRVEWRVDDSDIAALSFRGEQVSGRSGHAQYISERAEGHVLLSGDLYRLVDVFRRSNANRATGTMKERHVGWEYLIDTCPDNCMRLPAAHFHYCPFLSSDSGNFVQILPGKIRIPVLVDILHGDLPA